MKQGVMNGFRAHLGSGQRSIGLVLTGGTIGARNEAVLDVSGRSAGEVSDPNILGATEIALITGGTNDLDVQVRCPLRLLSENLKPEDWIPIADAVRDLAEIDDVSGVIVFHGTDTMAYTAAALSFLLADLDKPIVLTGSNLPPDQEGSDAARNAQDALVALRSLTSGTYIVFAGAEDLPGLVHLGTRARKQQASGQAYASVNTDPVASVVDGRFREDSALDARPSAPHSWSFRSAVDPCVLALRLYPGLNFAATFSAILEGGVRGVVVELYASATGPHTGDAYSLPKFIRRCAEHDILVATSVSAAPGGPSNIYETTVAIEEAGGLFLGDMLPETATVKLMWALAQCDSPEQLRELMRTPIAGEVSQQSLGS